VSSRNELLLAPVTERSSIGGSPLYRPPVTVTVGMLLRALEKELPHAKMTAPGLTGEQEALFKTRLAEHPNSDWWDGVLRNLRIAGSGRLATSRYSWLTIDWLLTGRNAEAIRNSTEYAGTVAYVNYHGWYSTRAAADAALQEAIAKFPKAKLLEIIRMRTGVSSSVSKTGLSDGEVVGADYAVTGVDASDIPAGAKLRLVVNRRKTASGRARGSR
jgi:hypothetical protein